MIFNVYNRHTAHSPPSTRYDVISGTEHGTSGPLLLAWAYEARRLFRDKLAQKSHLDKFDSILGAVLRSDWGVDIGDLDKVSFVLDLK